MMHGHTYIKIWWFHGNVFKDDCQLECDTWPGRHLTTILKKLFWPYQTLMCYSYSEAVCVFFSSFFFSFLRQLCWVVKSQVINKKMNEKQTSNMIRNAATSTEVRKRKIMDAVRIAFYPVVSSCFRLNYLYFLELY